MSKWKPGDVVRLKTGGWAMTVEEYVADEKSGTVGEGVRVTETRRTKNVSCVWFAKRPSAFSQTGYPAEYAWDGPNYGSFHEDALEATEATR